MFIHLAGSFVENNLQMRNTTSYFCGIWHYAVTWNILQKDITLLYACFMTHSKLNVQYVVLKLCSVLFKTDEREPVNILLLCSLYEWQQFNNTVSGERWWKVFRIWK